jgi:hypothetical protein
MVKGNALWLFRFACFASFNCCPMHRLLGLAVFLRNAVIQLSGNFTMYNAHMFMWALLDHLWATWVVSWISLVAPVSMIVRTYSHMLSSNCGLMVLAGNWCGCEQCPQQALRDGTHPALSDIIFVARRAEWWCSSRFVVERTQFLCPARMRALVWIQDTDWKTHLSSNPQPTSGHFVFDLPLCYIINCCLIMTSNSVGYHTNLEIFSLIVVSNSECEILPTKSKLNDTFGCASNTILHTISLQDLVRCVSVGI